MDNNPLAEVAVAPLASGKSKDVRVVKVIVETAACYREHKYSAEDPRSKCHIGLKAIDFALCPNCTWFGNRPPVTGKMLTGGEAMAVLATLESLKQTHSPETGMRPEGPAVLNQETDDE